MINPFDHDAQKQLCGLRSEAFSGRQREDQRLSTLVARNRLLQCEVLWLGFWFIVIDERAYLHLSAADREELLSHAAVAYQNIVPLCSLSWLSRCISRVGGTFILRSFDRFGKTYHQMELRALGKLDDPLTTLIPADLCDDPESARLALLNSGLDLSSLFTLCEQAGLLLELELSYSLGSLKRCVLEQCEPELVTFCIRQMEQLVNRARLCQ